MASDDFRVRVTCEDAEGLLENLHLSATSAEELADELKGQRLAVTRDDDTVFVYTDTRAQAEAVLPFVEGQGDVVIEHWLADEERWDDEPTHPSSDEDLIERGYAPWEVHVECESVEAARVLEAQLEEEGYSATRSFKFVIAGTETREEAVALAERFHGEAEPGGELVWKVAPQNPFARISAASAAAALPSRPPPARGHPVPPPAGDRSREKRAYLRQNCDNKTRSPDRPKFRYAAVAARPG